MVPRPFVSSAFIFSLPVNKALPLGFTPALGTLRHNSLLSGLPLNEFAQLYPRARFLERESLETSEFFVQIEIHTELTSVHNAGLCLFLSRLGSASLKDKLRVMRAVVKITRARTVLLRVRALFTMKHTTCGKLVGTIIVRFILWKFYSYFCQRLKRVIANFCARFFFFLSNIGFYRCDTTWRPRYFCLNS